MSTAVDDNPGETFDLPAAEPGFPLIAVAVYRPDGLPLYVLDADGGTLVPDTPAERAAAAALLARAAFELAEAPPVEPETWAEQAGRVADALEAAGTPEALAAHVALGDALEIHAGALEMASAALAAALPTTH